MRVGRMKAGPEQELADRYFDRFAKSGPAIGLEFSGVMEIAEGRAQTAEERRRDEAERLRGADRQGRGADRCSTNAARTSPPTISPKKSATCATAAGATCAIAIGGPDGHRSGACAARPSCAFLRRADLAAPAGARHAGRTALPRRDDPCRPSLSPRLKPAPIHQFDKLPRDFAASMARPELWLMVR